MTMARGRHAAVLLPNGQVALFGGTNGSGIATSSIETFDPAGIGAFTSNVASLFGPRSQLQATQLLGAGRLLISGGFTSGTTASTALELFTVSGTTLTQVTPIGSLLTARGGHTATLLFGATALIAGGTSMTTSGEVFSSAQ
jgi:hypothetical protein